MEKRGSEERKSPIRVHGQSCGAVWRNEVPEAETLLNEHAIFNAPLMKIVKFYCAIVLILPVSYKLLTLFLFVMSAYLTEILLHI